MAAFRPTGAHIFLGTYDLYPPDKVVSCFKGAVPPLTNTLSLPCSPVLVKTGRGRENLRG